MTARKFVVNLRARAPVWRIPAALEEEFLAVAPPGWSVEIVQAETVSDGDGGTDPSPESLAAIADAEVYVGFGITRDLFRAAPALRWVHSTTTGVAGSLFPEVVASDLVLTNSAGVHAVPMAEYVVAGLLHFWRGLDFAVAAQRESRWDKGEFIRADTPVREVSECTVVVVGTGGIGTAVATRLTALGARCVGVRRRVDAPMPDGFDRVVGLDALDDVLPGAEALVVSVPVTPGTRDAISAARLDLLPPHAVVVNVARGGLLDERALAERLASGRLRGAVLDVFEREPLAPESPLWQLRHALVTPHISPVTTRLFWDRQRTLIFDNWRRYVAGEPLRNVVNKDAGY